MKASKGCGRSRTNPVHRNSDVALTIWLPALTATKETGSDAGCRARRSPQTQRPAHLLYAGDRPALTPLAVPGLAGRQQRMG